MSLRAGLILLPLLLCSACAATSGPPGPVAASDALAWSDFDQLWIVSKASAATQRGTPPGGRLQAALADGQLRELTPDRLSSAAAILGRLGRVTLSAEFHSPAAESELFYELSLPRGAVVDEFELSVGQRSFRGIVREKAEAERLFASARAQGLRAILVEQQSDGAIHQRIAGVAPGSAIRVEFEYLATVRWQAGWCEFELPVSPRRQARVDCELTLEAGVPVAETELVGARGELARQSESSWHATVRSWSQETPAKLRWRIDVDEPRAALFVAEEGEDVLLFLNLYGHSVAGLLVEGLSSQHVASVDWDSTVILARAPRGSVRSAHTFMLSLRIGPDWFDELPIEPRAAPLRDLRSAWASAEVARNLRRALKARSRSEGRDLAARSQELALEHGIVSLGTAFLLISSGD